MGKSRNYQIQTTALRSCNSILVYSYLIVLIILLSSCKKSNNEILEIDDRIIGEWFYKDSIKNIGSVWHSLDSITYFEFPSPTFFSGIQISDSGIVPLCIEHSSGKVTIKPEKIRRKYYKISDGIIIKNATLMPYSPKDTIKYQLLNNELTLDYGNNNVKHYKRTKLGEKLFDRTITSFKYKLQNELRMNAHISNYISAFASRKSENELIIYGRGENHSIVLLIIDFKGIGQYAHEKFSVKLNSGAGDFFSTTQIDSPTIGEIGIYKYDEKNNRCRGTFSLTSYELKEEKPPRYLDIRDGHFDIPIIN